MTDGALTPPTLHTTFVAVTLAAMGALVLFEWRTGRYRDGRKTRADWEMFGWSLAGVGLIERPLLLATVTLLAERVVPDRHQALASLEQHHFAACLVGFIAIDELLHGYAHHRTHQPTPRHPWLARIHAFYRQAHRAHHLVGDRTDRGELSVTQSVVAGWGWMLFLPNYWVGMLALYLGLVETWFWGNLLKNLWGMHVHTNWRYDLALLRHPSPVVRRSMWALCHVLTFPNQHHHHHSRSRNSARNMQNMLALYDWLLWRTLVIEHERPAVYGWRQTPEEAHTLYRYGRRFTCRDPSARSA